MNNNFFLVIINIVLLIAKPIIKLIIKIDIRFLKKVKPIN